MTNYSNQNGRKEEIKEKGNKGRCRRGKKME
jgi:hypothetical protein